MRDALTQRVERFEVTGIVSTGMYEYDNAYAFVALDKAQNLAQFRAAVSQVYFSFQLWPCGRGFVILFHG